MSEGNILFRYEIEQIKDKKGTGYKIHINGSKHNKPAITNYTVEEYLVILQSLTNLSQFYIDKLNTVLVQNNEASFAKS